MFRDFSYLWLSHFSELVCSSTLSWRFFDPLVNKFRRIIWDVCIHIFGEVSLIEVCIDHENLEVSWIFPKLFVIFCCNTEKLSLQAVKSRQWGFVWGTIYSKPADDVRRAYIFVMLCFPPQKSFWIFLWNPPHLRIFCSPHFFVTEFPMDLMTLERVPSTIFLALWEKNSWPNGYKV